MTVKQIIVGTLLGAATVAVVLHRLPKAPVTLAKLPAKQDLKPVTAALEGRASPEGRAAGRHTHRKHVTDEKLSSSRLFS